MDDSSKHETKKIKSSDGFVVVDDEKSTRDNLIFMEYNVAKGIDENLLAEELHGKLEKQMQYYMLWSAIQNNEHKHDDQIVEDGANAVLQELPCMGKYWGGV